MGFLTGKTCFHIVYSQLRRPTGLYRRAPGVTVATTADLPQPQVGPHCRPPLTESLRSRSLCWLDSEAQRGHVGIKANVYSSVFFGLTDQRRFKMSSAEIRDKHHTPKVPQRWGRCMC